MSGNAARDSNGATTVDPDAGTIWSRRLGRPTAAVNRSTGYVQVTVSLGDGRTRTIVAHRVIWESIHGPIPEGLEINHINGDKQDNRISNMELVTRRGNIVHARF